VRRRRLVVWRCAHQAGLFQQRVVVAGNTLASVRQPGGRIAQAEAGGDLAGQAAPFR
jgi:hypothetical protein